MSTTGTILQGIDLALSLLNRAAAISSLVARAQSEGREKFHPEEWSAITGDDDKARAELVAAIAKAKG